MSLFFYVLFNNLFSFTPPKKNYATRCAQLLMKRLKTLGKKTNEEALQPVNICSLG